MKVLVVNAGSSSLKLRLLDDDGGITRSADLPALRGRGAASQLKRTVADWPRPDVVGHRFVHGGPEFHEAVVVDREVVNALWQLVPLARLHQPAALRALDLVSAALRGVPAVACFDTAFHADLPAAARTYAVPDVWRERFGIRRYGFHGLSHAHVAQRAGELLGGRPARLVSCHLGSGASLCAVADGRSVDTTMGFTPLDGLVMATRCGALDPGIVVHLQTQYALNVRDIERDLETGSGLLGLAGTGDLRELETRLDDGDERAALAFDVYLHALVKGVCAMAGSLGGLDALVFTGGVGENSRRVRAEVGARLGWLGVAVHDEEVAPGTDADVTAGGAAVRTLVVAAREDLTIAAECRAAVGG